jgi:hypothetical protein
MTRLLKLREGKKNAYIVGSEQLQGSASWALTSSRIRDPKDPRFRY